MTPPKEPEMVEAEPEPNIVLPENIGERREFMKNINTIFKKEREDFMKNKNHLYPHTYRRFTSVCKRCKQGYDARIEEVATRKLCGRCKGVLYMKARYDRLKNDPVFIELRTASARRWREKNRSKASENAVVSIRRRRARLGGEGKCWDCKITRTDYKDDGITLHKYCKECRRKRYVKWKEYMDRRKWI